MIVSLKTFYNYKIKYLKNKLIVIMVKKTLKKFKFMGYPVQPYKLGKTSYKMYIYEFGIGNKSGYGIYEYVNLKAKNLITAKKKVKRWIKSGMKKFDRSFQGKKYI